MYPSQDIEVPKSFQPSYPYKDSIGCGLDLRDEILAPFPRSEYSIQVNRSEYYAIITHMDFQIGRILDALYESPAADNTYIIFTADHGLACGEHGLMGKQNMYDHSIRVPWIIVGPDIPLNKQVKVLSYLQDVMPTTLELAGSEIPEHVEFKSLVPVLRGEIENHYSEIFGGYMEYQRMIRTERYKLILYPKGQTVLLHDLENDPLELINLAEGADHQDVARELFKRLVAQQRELGDDLDLTGLFPQLN